VTIGSVVKNMRKMGRSTSPFLIDAPPRLMMVTAGNAVLCHAEGGNKLCNVLRWNAFAAAGARRLTQALGHNRYEF